MHILVRKHLGFFLGIALAGLALRLLFFAYYPAITDDSRIYADFAANWLRHGIYGQTESGQVVPTDARLPGYPAFLALIFALFGVGNFRAVLLAQIVVDMGTCFIVADLARRTISERAAGIAFALAALCPFLANYASAALTETLEIFFTALALDCAVAGLDSLNPEDRTRSSWAAWAGCGAALAACILLRPDGGLLLASIGLYVLFLLWTRWRSQQSVVPLLKGAVVLSLFAAAPAVPWTVRNFHMLHHFQPLTSRYAAKTDELVPRGFNRWVRTWMAEYTSVEEIYWNVPGVNLDSAKLPNRAYDSPSQKEQTLALIADYNRTTDMTPELDARFGALAAERVRAHPVRYYVTLPCLRVADMWLRPRSEILPPDPRWWEFNDDPKSSVMAVGFGLLNLAYVGAALVALLRKPRTIRYAGLLLGFVLLRSAFLGTLENPEPRYTLECYPVVILFASALFHGRGIDLRSNAD